MVNVRKILEIVFVNPNRVSNPVRVVIISVLSLFVSCGEPLMNYDITTKTPIVEAYVEEGQTTLTVNVFSMEVYVKDGYELSDPIGGLNVAVNGLPLTETSVGVYTLDLGEDTVRGGQQFEMTFDYNGKTIRGQTVVPLPVENLQASTTMVEHQEMFNFGDEASDTVAVSITWDDPDGSFYQIFTEPPASETTSSGMGGFGGMTLGKRVMQPRQGSEHTITGREFTTAGHYYITVYRVCRDYVELYERISSTDLANPVSNIENAFGIFTGMSSARVRIYAY